MRTRTPRIAAAALALGLLAGACSDDGESADDTTTTAMAEESTTTTTAMESEDAMEGDDLVDTAMAAGDFSTLITAVQAAGLEETLRGEGPFTVFAPSDAAFEALPEGTLETLLEDPMGDLAGILTYHVVEGAVMAEDVAGMDGQEVTTVNGATFTVNVADDGSVSLTDAAGNEVAVTSTDVEASNGVIHVVESVLMPG
jgi:uncharacterized surface protein with fasciclin (FAS1) repeats